MAAASLVQSIFAGLIHPTTGAELASCVCRFYQPGSLTPETVYSDSLGASPIAQPVILSAAGEATVYITNPVRLIVKDAIDSTTIFDIAALNANVADAQTVTTSGMNGGAATTLKTIFDAWTTSAGGSAGFWQLKQASTATERNVKDVVFERAVSAKDYGAIGNDAAADGAALAAAIVAANAGPKKLVIPEGTYRISAALLNSTSGLWIEGAGSGLTIIKNMGTTTDSFTLTAATTVRNIGFSAGTSTSGRAIGCDAGSGYDIRDVIINGHKQGIQGAGLTASVVQNITGTQATTATATDPMIGGPLSSSVLFNCRPVADGGVGLLISTGAVGTYVFGYIGTVNVTATGAILGFVGCSGSMTIASGGSAVDCILSTLNVTDNRTATTGLVLSCATGASILPNAAACSARPMDRVARVTITATGGAGTVTISGLASNLGGDNVGFWVVILKNSAGGNVVWSFGTGFTMGGGGNPTTADTTTLVIMFVLNSATGKFQEASRMV